MSQEENYTKDEYYEDWRNNNIHQLKEGYLKENYLGSVYSEFPEDFIDAHEDEFEAYCRYAFKDRD